MYVPYKSLICFHLLVHLAACKKVSSESDSSQSGGSFLPRAASSVGTFDELRISQLRIDLPNSLTPKANPRLKLAAKKRSADACMIGDRVNETADRIRLLASLACHVEVEKNQIEFDKKYRVKLADDSVFAHLLVQKEGETVKLYLCQKSYGLDRFQMIVTQVSSQGPKGSFRNAGVSQEEPVGESTAGGLVQEGSAVNELQWSSAVEFDLSQEGRKLIEAKDKIGKGSEGYLSYVQIQTVKDSVSTVNLASQGSYGGIEFTERGVAKFSAQRGATLFKYANNGEASPADYTYVDYFDSDGYTMEKTASTDFDAILKISADELPALLPQTFTPAPVESWAAQDCANPETDVTFDFASEAHSACDKDLFYETASCSSEDFEAGETYDEPSVDDGGDPLEQDEPRLKVAR